MAIALGISTAHPRGESATRSGALAALLLLAGARLPAQSRLASTPRNSTCGHVQLRFLG
jgi:hypothetical protein